MKDAQGHGSNPRGSYAAHQDGINEKVPTAAEYQSFRKSIRSNTHDMVAALHADQKTSGKAQPPGYAMAVNAIKEWRGRHTRLIGEQRRLGL